MLFSPLFLCFLSQQRQERARQLVFLENGNASHEFSAPDIGAQNVLKVWWCQSRNSPLLNNIIFHVQRQHWLCFSCSDC